jgi:hypothetical protein
MDDNLLPLFSLLIICPSLLCPLLQIQFFDDGTGEIKGLLIIFLLGMFHPCLKNAKRMGQSA